MERKGRKRGESGEQCERLGKRRKGEERTGWESKTEKRGERRGQNRKEEEGRRKKKKGERRKDRIGEK